MQIGKLQDAVSKAKKQAQKKIGSGRNADEFVEIAEADGFKIYVTVGKTVKRAATEDMHENPRDVFILVLEGEMELAFADGKKARVKTGEFFVLPKHVMHACVFKRMTIAVEGVFEKGL